MAKTLQDLINSWRIKVGETDPTNSRWQDSIHGIYYINKGRKEFSREAKCIFTEMRKLTGIGGTVAGGGEEARYTLHPLMFNIISVKFDGLELHKCGINWEDETGRIFDTNQPIKLGTPFAYRKIGNSVDLFYQPSEQKTLLIVGNIVSTDLTSLTQQDLELTDDQTEFAVCFAAHEALKDDGRDSTLLFNEFQFGAKKYEKICRPTTPSGVRQSSLSEY